MLPVLQIGPLAVPVPGLTLILGVWLGLSLAERHAPQHGIPAERLFNLALSAILAGLAGARALYILRYPAAFANNPLDMFSRNPGLLDPLGGLASAAIAGWIYLQRNKLPGPATLDAITPLFATLYVALGISHLASGDFYGRATEIPWAIQLWDEMRHPTQVYEIAAAAIIMGALWPANARQRFPAAGQYFATFLAASSAAWLFIEGFRADSSLLPGGVRAGQALAWIILAGSLWLRLRLTAPKEDQPPGLRQAAEPGGEG